MPKVTHRLPGKEQYSYAEVEFDSEEYISLGSAEIQQTLLDALNDLNATFQAMGGQNQGVAQSGPVQQSTSNIPSCPHGQRVERKGSSARGQWRAYMCPLKDRDNQCKPIDADTGIAWK